MRFLFVPALLASALCFGQTAGKPAPGFSVEWLDRSVEPCQDFYQFACGGWMQRNPIPPDQSRWSQFNLLLDRNQELLRDILEGLARSAKSGEDRKLGDFYAACMDEPLVQKLGLKPIEAERRLATSFSDPARLADVVARLHNLGVPVLFGFGSSPDYKNSKVEIAIVAQGGLGLPDRDYYFRTDAKSNELRNKYEAHIARTFALAGSPREVAQEKAARVLALEKKLADASLDRIARRQPEKNYHKMDREGLAKLAPSFNWSHYFSAVNAPDFAGVNVQNPDFVQRIEELVSRADIPSWRDYLEWHLLRTASPHLPAPFVSENFDFFGRTMTGAKELRPRWKRCVELTDRQMGEALGKKYVDKAFPGEAKQKMLALVENVQSALEEDIRQLDWMTEETRARAIEKLSAIRNKIGYPEQWRDYSTLTVRRDDPVGNVFRANRFEFLRDVKKIGHEVDPMEWSMTPPTVNAYYSPLMNNINFPAGILQPPFYDPKIDEAVNYGGIGAVIGHELSHGFDDQGRKFSGSGNLEDWWTEKDAKAFEERAACIDQQYAGYTAIGDLKLNGKLTLGENVADNGGLRLAYMALQKAWEKNPAAAKEGFTPEQRFFLGWAQVWCQNMTDESARLRAQTDPHSPGKYRTNGVVSNMPEFQKAFSCKQGDPMVRQNQCRVW